MIEMLAYNVYKRGNILLSLYTILLSKTINGTILGIIMIMMRHVLGIMHQINSEHVRIMGNFIFDPDHWTIISELVYLIESWLYYTFKKTYILELRWNGVLKQTHRGMDWVLDAVKLIANNEYNKLVSVSAVVLLNIDSLCFFFVSNLCQHGVRHSGAYIYTYNYYIYIYF